MATYRARVIAIKHAAVDKDLSPTGHGIAMAIGIPAGTVNAMFHGRPPRTPTIAAIVKFFGGTVEDYFELVDDDIDQPVPA